MKFKGLLGSTVLLVSISFFQFSCSRSSSSSNDNATSSTQLSTNLKTLATNIAPNALRSSNSYLTSGDPCAAFTDTDRFRNFLSCQPTLLSNYIQQASSFIKGVSSAIEEIETALTNASDGSNGSVTISNNVIAYTKTNVNQFTIEISNSTGQKLLSLSKNAKNITLKIDAWFLQKSVTTYSNSFGVYEGTIEYTDDKDWTLNLFLGGIPCDSNAVDSPERIKLIVSYSGDLWTGKAMTFHPRKSGDACTSSPDTSKINVYTDFVGNTDATRASVYMLNDQVKTLEKIDSFQLGKLCVNYPSICEDHSTDYTAAEPAVTLPFCVTAIGKEPTWGNSCTAYPIVNDASYGSQNDWTLPNTFDNQALPSVGL